MTVATLKLGTIEKEIDLAALQPAERNVLLVLLGIRQEADGVFQSLMPDRPVFRTITYREARMACSLHKTCERACTFQITTEQLPESDIAPYRRSLSGKAVRVNAKLHKGTAACASQVNVVRKKSLILVVNVRGFDMVKFYQLQ